MAKTPLIAGTAPLSQPSPGSTRKDQKRYQLGDAYDAREVNSALDAIYQRLNSITVEGAYSPTATALKTDGTPTNAQICTQINNLITDLAALAAIVKQAGVVKS